MIVFDTVNICILTPKHGSGYRRRIMYEDLYVPLTVAIILLLLDASYGLLSKHRSLTRVGYDSFGFVLIVVSCLLWRFWEHLVASFLAENLTLLAMIPTQAIYTIHAVPYLGMWLVVVFGVGFRVFEALFLPKPLDNVE